MIKKRCSVRRYQATPVPEEAIGQLLEAARWAPSAGNLQPWFFYVVRSQGVKECLAAAALEQRFIAQAPVVIVVCAEPERSARVYGERGRRLYCYQDTAAAVQNILLAATAMGLGTCWVGFVEMFKFGFKWKRKLGIRWPYRLIEAITLGYPVGEPDGMVERELHEIDWWENGAKRTVF